MLTLAANHGVETVLADTTDDNIASQRILNGQLLVGLWQLPYLPRPTRPGRPFMTCCGQRTRSPARAAGAEPPAIGA